jgi:hypothetical protein
MLGYEKMIKDLKLKHRYAPPALIERQFRRPTPDKGYLLPPSTLLATSFTAATSQAMIVVASR